MWEATRQLGVDGVTLILEGLIGKRSGSRYEPGKRNRAWIKIKLHQEQEFVIGGYTEPEGSRKYFGALLVGFYEGEKLKFAGRVGTGFTAIDATGLSEGNQFQPCLTDATGCD